MATSALGLSSQNESSVLEYLQFARFKRSQCLKAIDSAFRDFSESRLVEDTFTSDEVSEMLTSLCDVMKADVESELINSSHTNALLLRQLFLQGEKWHLKMQADISEIENRELLDQIAQFEKKGLSSSSQYSTPVRRQLEPVNTAGGDKLLQLEIQRLREENDKLKERVQTLGSKATSALSEKDRLQSDLAARRPPSTGGVEQSVSGEELASLQEKIQQLTMELTKTKSSETMPQKQELTETAHQLLKVSSELEATKKELECRFNETSQYVNMRKMLATKNDTIKDLRTKLKKYDSIEQK